MRRPWLLIAVFGALSAGCGVNAITSRPPPDQPVPASEPRASITARVDLVPAQDCEEAFDLALYSNRAIDLIAWDASTDVCEGRRIEIRYLSGKIQREQVVDAIREHAARVAVEPGE